MSETALERLSRHPEWRAKAGMVYRHGHHLRAVPLDWEGGRWDPDGAVIAEHPANVGRLIEFLEDAVSWRWKLTVDEHGVTIAWAGRSTLCLRPCEALAAAILLGLEGDDGFPGRQGAK